MRVFVTGATGNIGSRVVKDLIAAGHQVIGLCRSDDKAPALAAAGAEVYRGSIAEPDSLKDGAARSDGVIHLAFNHDFSRFVQNCEDDRRVIKALGSVLAGSDRPLIVTSGTPIANTVPGRPAKEDNATVGSDVHPRAASEEAAASVAVDGVNVSVVRLPQVHDPVTQGLITPAIATIAKRARAHISETALIAGRRPTFSTSRDSIGWRSNGPNPTRSITPSRKKASDAGYRRSDRPPPQPAGQIDRPGRGSGLLRLACRLCRARFARFERTDAQKARMGADRPAAGRRPRTVAPRRRLKN